MIVVILRKKLDFLGYSMKIYKDRNSDFRKKIL